MSIEYQWTTGSTSLTALVDLTAGASVRGLLASGVVRVESVQWIDQQVLEVTFRDGEGQLGKRLVDRDDDLRL